MRKVNGLVRDIREKVRLLQEECDSLTNNDPYGSTMYERSPHLVMAELTKLRAERNGHIDMMNAAENRADQLAQDVDRLKTALANTHPWGNAQYLKEARADTRRVLGAGPMERTAAAARRVVEENKRVQYENTRLSVRLQAAERAASEGTPRDRTALKALRESRKAVREILGAKRGESTRDAAQRVRNEQRARPLSPFVTEGLSSDPTTAIGVYKDLDKRAIAEGFPPGSVKAYVYSLREKAGK